MKYICICFSYDSNTANNVRRKNNYEDLNIYRKKKQTSTFPTLHRRHRQSL